MKNGVHRVQEQNNLKIQSRRLRVDSISPLADLDEALTSSPIGCLSLKASSLGLRSIHFCGRAVHQTSGRVQNLHLQQAIDELDAYFRGNLRSFGVSLDLQGTAFQLKVWRELLKIPFGQQRSYSEIAESILNPRASRAVGMANNRNPIPIMVPCHRVVGKSGNLVGYAGGLEIKFKLLEFEKRIIRGTNLGLNVLPD